jgi:cell division control protein 6
VSFEEEFEKKGIFKDESKLSSDYVPENLPFRDVHIKQLISFFKGMVENPGGVFYKAVAYGPVGTGKTAVAKRFGSSLINYATSKGVKIKYVHINCYQNRTLFMVIKRIADALIPNLPPRGFSAQELLDVIWGYLEDKDFYIFAVIDELDYLAKLSPDALYTLTRLSDAYLDRKQRISILFIGRNLAFLPIINQSVASTLSKNMIRFEPYKSSQILKILEQRVEDAFKSSVVGNDVLTLVAEASGVDTGGNGDARYALELLWRAGKIAEQNGSQRVLPEHVRIAKSEIHPFIRDEILLSLTNHELLLLQSIASLLKKNYGIHVSFSDVEEEYNLLCEAKNIEPRKHTQLWEYLQNLKNAGLIYAKTINKGNRGRTTIISIHDIPAEVLERQVKTILEERINEK